MMQLGDNDFNMRLFSVNTANPHVLMSAQDSLRPYLSEPAEYCPGFDKWYLNVSYQFVCGNREIIIVYRKSGIAGFAILKKSIYENKICTFKINEPYRRNGVATRLMSASLDILGLKNILITMPDFYHEDFAPLMGKFGFLKICQKNNLYVKNHSEFFYVLNPHLPICSGGQYYRFPHGNLYSSRKADAPQRGVNRLKTTSSADDPALKSKLFNADIYMTLDRAAGRLIFCAPPCPCSPTSPHPGL